MSKSPNKASNAASLISPSNRNQNIVLAENLHSFLNLAAQTPIENVCKSALFLLSNIPASRHAAMDYIGAFYDIAVLLNINFVLAQKNQTSNQASNVNAEANNIGHINQIIDAIELEIAELLVRSDTRDVWSNEIAVWLIDVLLAIVTRHSSHLTQIVGVPDESSLTLVDYMQYWSIQCRPTQSVLKLLQACFLTAQQLNDTTSYHELFECLMNASNKSSRFDWTLCDIGALDPGLMIRKCFVLGINEQQHPQPPQQSIEVKRAAAINFFALNFSSTFKSELDSVIADLRDKNDQNAIKIFITYLLNLTASSHCPAVLNLLLNELLSDNAVDLVEMTWPFLVERDTSIVELLVECIKQLNNNIAVQDLIVAVLDWISELEKKPNGTILIDLTLSKIRQLQQCVYASCTNTSIEIPFLKSLNSINSSSLRQLLDHTMKNLNTTSSTSLISQNLLTLLGINGNNYCANTIMSELLTLKYTRSGSDQSINEKDETIANDLVHFMLEFRQDISLFYPYCLRESLLSLIKFFANNLHDNNRDMLINLIDNVTLIYEWDLANPNYMSENIANILLERLCFSNLIDLLSIEQKDHSRLALNIIKLYNRLLTSRDTDLPDLHVGMEEVLKCGVKLINRFYDLCFSLDETNIELVTLELNELSDLVRNTCKHFSYNYSESNSPYRNILLRTLIDRLFISLNRKQPVKHKLNEEQDLIDENSNLFVSNMSLINSEIMLSKSKLKAVRNKLIDNEPLRRRQAIGTHPSNTTIFNFAFLDMLETICSKVSSSSSSSRRDGDKASTEMDVDSINDEEKEIDEMTNNLQKLSRNDELRNDLLGEQMNNLAELLLEHVLLKQYYVDYSWPSNGDLDDMNNEADVEFIRINIERDMAVQNMVENSNNRRIIWQILDFLALDEKSFITCGPIIRSLLASQIIQWESSQEQSARNLPKLFDITLKLLNILNRAKYFLPTPLGYIVDIVPLLTTYETHIALLIIWRHLKVKMNTLSSIKNETSLTLKQQAFSNALNVDTKQLRYIFQKNIGKLAPYYAKFFGSTSGGGKKKQSELLSVVAKTESNSN